MFRTRTRSTTYTIIQKRGKDGPSGVTTFDSQSNSVDTLVGRPLGIQGQGDIFKEGRALRCNIGPTLYKRIILDIE
jgi:hypothetical protein